MTDCDRLLLRRICRLMARTGRGDTHQACPLLKVNRPCHLAAVTSQIDPQPTWGKLKSRVATALCYPLRREAREEQGSETARVHHTACTDAWRKNTKFGGTTEIGPVMPKIAISTLSPALTASAMTTRFGMLKPWIVAGLVMPTRRGISPLTHTSA